MTGNTDNYMELIYYSYPIKTFRESDISRMLTQVRPKNHAMDVTGMLLYANEQFLQVLEGRKKDVNQIFQSISHDARHYDVNLISVRNIQQRSFERWDMAFSGGDDVHHLGSQLNLADFNAATLTPEEALALAIRQNESGN